ncbi:lipid II flippase MurJ [Haloarcula sp. CGMCC 1.2071]|uniref:lipid II flippase MurJ n=1 Tax=Haloarcula sp. CGMCC 1.2071 TaxID=3111454 RepID=UPI00300EC239
MLPFVSDIAAAALWTIREVYRLTRKLVVLFTLPLVVLLLRFPGEILSVLFGPAYSTGQLAPSILTVGLLTHVVAGPNRETLIALGRSRLVFSATTLVLVANVVCNPVLIPPVGTAGTALASMISYTRLNIVLTRILMRRYQITPVSPALLWSCTVGVLGLGLALTGIRYVIPAVEFALVGSTIAVTLSYPVLFVLGFEPADARLVRQFESSIPVNTERLLTRLSRHD